MLHDLSPIIQGLLGHFRARQAFDNTKASVKGLDANVDTIPAIFHNPLESLPLDNTPTLHHSHHGFSVPVINLTGLVMPSRRASAAGGIKGTAEMVGFLWVTLESAMSETLAAVRGFIEGRWRPGRRTKARKYYTTNGYRQTIVYVDRV